MNLNKSRRNAIRSMLKAGEYEDAVKRATDWGFVIGPNGSVQLAPAQAPAPTPLAPMPKAERGPLVTVTSEDFKSNEPEEAATPPLWPAEDNAVVVHRPLNKRMMGIELSDGRRVNMWKVGGHNHPIGSRVRVKLYEMVGPEAYYEPITSEP